MTSPLYVSPLAAQRTHLAEMDKQEAAYAEAWWTQRRPSRPTFAKRASTPLRGSFSNEDVPYLDSSSGLTTPSHTVPGTPAEWVQEYFELAQKNREKYNKEWSTATARHVLGVHDPHDPATKLNYPTRNSNKLAAQLDKFADRFIRESNYNEACANSNGLTLQVHEPRDPAIKIASASENFNPLSVQLKLSAECHSWKEAYNDAWINAANNRTLLVSSNMVASTSSTPYPVAVRLQLEAERRERERAYEQAWINAVKNHSLVSENTSTPTPPYCEAVHNRNEQRIHEEDAYDQAWINASKEGSIGSKVEPASNTTHFLAVQRLDAEYRRREESDEQTWIDATKNGSIIGAGTRLSAIQIAHQTHNLNTLAAQLRAAKDEEAAEQAYADTWSHYREIMEFARALDAWKAHNLELLEHEAEYYNAWTDTVKTLAFRLKASRPAATKIALSKYETNTFASQLVMFQDLHAREEEYNEAWIAYSNHQIYVTSPPIIRSPRRWSANSRRLSVSRSPRPAFTKRLPIDAAVSEHPMLGFSTIELVSENDNYVNSWVDRMSATTITPANSLLLAVPSTKKRVVPSSPRPKKRGDKGHFTWPEGFTDEEKLGMTTRGNLQPYLSSLLGKIVSFELVGQSEPNISPDEATVETPMKITRRAQFKCQNQTVCKVMASVSITSPEPARRYAHHPLPLFEALRSLGHAAVIQLDEVGLGKLSRDNTRQSIWRRYSVVSGAFRCEVMETFVDRKMFSPEGCDFGKKITIKNGLIMSPDGTDYMALPL